jgi:hypothetical protein
MNVFLDFVLCVMNIETLESVSDVSWNNLTFWVSLLEEKLGGHFSPAGLQAS